MLPSNQVSRLLKISGERSALFVAQKASICHIDNLEPGKNTYRWPYEKKPYTWYNFWKDPFTTDKFNENTKLIQIEGNINAGKRDFAHKLAKQLGMHVMEPMDIEPYYINNHGYDYRALNPLLPERLRLCDMEMFHENPSRHSNLTMLYVTYKTRLFQHIKALQHMFNTGQGVILIRGCATDRVLVDAMHDLGWLPKGYLRGDGVRFYDFRHRHLFIRNVTISYLQLPHLTIYLNTPVDVCLERSKNSSDPIEANSRALIPEYFEAIEDNYRTNILPKIDHYSHLLEYDTPELMTDEEVSEVVDHITELNFEFDDHDTKFELWEVNAKLWHMMGRIGYTTEYLYRKTFSRLETDWYDIAGLGDSITAADLHLRTALFEAHVGPVGYFVSKEHDVKINGWLRSLFGPRKTLNERLDDVYRSDFL